jgi:hypothetical protein
MDTTHKQPFMINGGQANDWNTALPPQTPDRITELQYSVWAIRDAIERMNRDIQLLLDERTRPLTFEAVQVEAKKLPTEETPQVTIEPNYNRVKGTRLSSASELITRKVIAMGGAGMLKKKYDAGLVKVYIYPFNNTASKRNRGFHGAVNFTDETIRNNKSGNAKQFTVNCRTSEEYAAAIEQLAAILGPDFRSRYA